jgi:arylsulfatase
MAIYAAVIDRLDRSIGNLVEGLRKRGALDNTVIVFVSDNGGNAESGPDGRLEGKEPGNPQSVVFEGQSWATLSNTPFRRYKHFVHEGGIASPNIIHWPAGIPMERRGKLESQPAHLVDLMATCVDLAGAKYPTEYKEHSILPTEGVSIRPAFQGQPIGRRQPLFWEHEGNRALRDGKWKLVAEHQEEWQLYDLEADRTERNDLADRYPEKVKELLAKYEAWAKRCGVEPWPIGKKN